ncbi:DUF805 domain-containing protein [Leisingera thetidis]|uniref:DUF805 domain-containing protein n=1 Tax=Leisingera thetidis TaxID=2930199 RepID=UPI0021F7B3E4|nr:DUF805 domain-containing protein [Leisingera thetidis]
MIPRIPSAFESFAFKFLDFGDRATRLEYWCVIPVVWLLIFLMLPGEAAEVRGHLSRREVPPLNPFHYGSLGLFLFTFLPRLSLTVRRLNDAGRSGRWARLPFVAVSLGLMMSFGFATSLPTADQSGLGVAVIAGGAVVAALSGGFWETMFNFAAIANAVNWDAVLGTLLGAAAKADVSAGLQTAQATGLQNPAVELQFLFYSVFFGLVPALAILVHLYFMRLPSERDDNIHGASSAQAPAHANQDSKRNAYAGYAYLTKRTGDEEKMLQAARKAQIRELYQSRVLGKTNG